MSFKNLTLLVTSILLLSSVSLLVSAEERDIPTGGVPSTHPHYDHYIYDVKCIPDENFYQIDPSGGKYQPEEWRTAAYTKPPYQWDYGILFNDSIWGKEPFYHTCALENGITINTIIDYDRKVIFPVPAPPDGAKPPEDEEIEINILVNVLITAKNGHTVHFDFLGGGNHHLRRTKKGLKLEGQTLKVLAKKKSGDQLFEYQNNYDLSKMPDWRK